MSGSITAGDVRTGNFLDALAHPQVVNPLAAYSGAAEAANRVWGIRKWQAEQAAGEAQQAGIDASGIYQPNTAAAALKAAGPGAALAAGPTLESSQRLGTAQTDQAAKISALFATTVAPLINLPDDQLHQGVLDAAQRLIAAGAPAAQVHAGLLNMSTDPATLRRQLEMIRQSHLPPEQQQGEIYGTRPTIDTPGAVYQPVVPPVRTGVSVTTPKGPPPGQVTPAFDPYDDQGQIPRDANGKPSRTPKFWQPSTVPVTAVPGVPAGGPPQLTDRAGRPLSSSLQNPNAAPGTPPGRNAPVTPPPAVAPASPLGNAPQAATPAPPAPAAVTPAPAATPPAVVPAAKPPVVTAAPQGQPQRLEADQKAYQIAQDEQGTLIQNVQIADTARQALQLATTGRGTGDMHNIYSFLKARGIPTPYDDDIKNYDIARKSLLQLAQSSGQKIGSDLGLDTAIHSNASVDIDKAAALHVLNQQIGWFNQKIAMYHEAPDKTGLGYMSHQADFPATVAPEAFAWDRLDPAEQAAITKKYTDAGKLPMLDHSLEIALRHGRIAVPPPAKNAAPQKQSSTIPQPSSNLLALAGGAAPGNALAAA